MILVTGATGTIGRPLVKLLPAADETVPALSRHPGVPNDMPSGVERCPDYPHDTLSPGVTQEAMQ